MRELTVAVLEAAESGPKNLPVIQTVDPEGYELAPHGIREKVVDRTLPTGRSIERPGPRSSTKSSGSESFGTIPGGFADWVAGFRPKN
jgi:hypothetical protein